MTDEHDIPEEETDESIDEARPAEPPASLLACLLGAVVVAVCGGTLIGLAEYMAARLFFRSGIADEAWPFWLELGAAGRPVVSYVLGALPPLLIVSGLYWLVRGSRDNASAEPLLLGVFMVLIALFVMPYDLQLAHQTSLGVTVAAYVLVLYLAAMLYLLGRVLRSWWGPRALRRRLMILAVPCALLALTVGLGLLRSPLGHAAGYVAARPAAGAPGAGSPDVLLVILDTARGDHMSVYGYDKPTTPWLEGFADEAIVFDGAISNGVWTVPTHASMFTGRSIREHGLGRVAPKLRQDHRTAAEVLKDAGYATGLFTNNPLLSNRTSLARGFDDRFTVFQWMRSVRYSFDQMNEATGWMPLAPWLDLDYGAAVTNALVSDWLTQQSGKPVFACVNVMEAHLPYRVPRSYREQFMSAEAVPRSYALRRAVHGELEGWLHNTAIIDGYDDMPALDREAIRGQYDAGLRYLDDRLAELIDLFRAAGRLDNTLVVITSDHGEYLDTHGMWSHHFLTYQDVINIPLIIRAPQGPRGVRIPERVQLTDIVPTILAATVGAEAWPEGLKGRDLLADTLEARPAIAEHYGAGAKYEERLLQKTDRKLRHRAARQLVVIDGDLKYIWSSDGMRELFDLSVDPTEQNNLAATRPKDVVRLQQMLDRWKTATPEMTTRDLQKSGWDKGVMEQLKALGYVGDD